MEYVLQVLNHPSLEFVKNLGRSPLPLRALAFSPDGKTLAAAGDAENIKLHNSKDGAVSDACMHTAACRRDHAMDG